MSDNVAEKIPTETDKTKTMAFWETWETVGKNPNQNPAAAVASCTQLLRLLTVKWETIYNGMSPQTLSSILKI